MFADLEDYQKKLDSIKNDDEDFKKKYAAIEWKIFRLYVKEKAFRKIIQEYLDLGKELNAEIDTLLKDAQ